MADKKISALTAATTPLAGTEVLPIVQSGATDNITVNNLAAGNLKSQTTTGVLQITGPTAAAVRVMTVPDASFTAARTDAAQNFVGSNTFDTTTVVVDATNHFAGFGTNAPKHPVQVYGVIKAGGAPNQQYGIIALGDDSSTSTYNGVYRGGIGTVGSGNYVNIGGYAGVNITVGAAQFGSQTTVAQFGAADMTLNAGNLVQGTAAKGINFSANTPAAGKTSQLLNWYEEGTWTPTFSGLTVAGTATYTGYYTRIGRQVSFTILVESTVTTAASSGVTTFSLPFGSPLSSSTCQAVNGATAAGIGIGMVYAGDGSGYPPAWAATAKVVLYGSYFV